MAFKTQTEGQWSSKQTPSSVAHKFEKLFSTDRHNCRDAIMKSPSGKAVANDIFEVITDTLLINQYKITCMTLYNNYTIGDTACIRGMPDYSAEGTISGIISSP